MAQYSNGARAVILYLGGVPMIDITGLVALESSILKLHHAGVIVVLAAVNEEVARAINRSHLATIPHAVSIHKTLAGAEMYVRLVLPEEPAASQAV